MPDASWLGSLRRGVKIPDSLRRALRFRTKVPTRIPSTSPAPLPLPARAVVHPWWGILTTAGIAAWLGVWNWQGSLAIPANPEDPQRTLLAPLQRLQESRNADPFAPSRPPRFLPANGPVPVPRPFETPSSSPSPSLRPDQPAHNNAASLNTAHPAVTEDPATHPVAAPAANGNRRTETPETLTEVAPAQAQARAPRPARVDEADGWSRPQPLEAFLAAALAHNQGLNAARHNVEAQRQRIVAAQSLEDPTASHVIQPFPSHANQFVTGFMPWSATISQRFPWFGTLALRSQAAQQEAQAALWELAARELDVVTRVKRAYYALDALQNSQRILQESRNRAEELAALAKLQFEVGKRGQQDVFRAQRAREEVQREFLLLDQRLAQARAELARWSHLPPNLPLRTRTDSANPANAANAASSLPNDLDALLALAARFRPELHRSLANLARNQSAVALARKKFRPDWNLGLNYQLMSKTNAASPIADGFDNFGFVAEFNLPVYRQKLQANWQAALHEAYASAALWEDARDAAFQEVREQFADVTATRQLQELLKNRLLPLTQNTYNAAVSEYRVGNTEFLDVINAWTDHLRLELELTRLDGELGQNLAGLERAVGLGCAPKQTIPIPNPSATHPQSPQRDAQTLPPNPTSGLSRTPSGTPGDGPTSPRGEQNPGRENRVTPPVVTPDTRQSLTTPSARSSPKRPITVTIPVTPRTQQPPRFVFPKFPKVMPDSRSDFLSQPGNAAPVPKVREDAARPRSAMSAAPAPASPQVTSQPQPQSPSQSSQGNRRMTNAPWNRNSQIPLPGPISAPPPAARPEQRTLRKTPKGGSGSGWDRYPTEDAQPPDNPKFAERLAPSESRYDSATQAAAGRTPDPAAGERDSGSLSPGIPTTADNPRGSP